MGASKVFPLALKGPVLTRRRNRTLEARLHRNLLSKRVLSLIPCFCFIGILVCATKFSERFLCYCHNMPICGAVLGDLLLFFSKFGPPQASIFQAAVPIGQYLKFPPVALSIQRGPPISFPSLSFTDYKKSDTVPKRFLTPVSQAWLRGKPVFSSSPFQLCKTLLLPASC